MSKWKRSRNRILIRKMERWLKSGPIARRRQFSTADVDEWFKAMRMRSEIEYFRYKARNNNW